MAQIRNHFARVSLFTAVSLLLFWICLPVAAAPSHDDAREIELAKALSSKGAKDQAIRILSAVLARSPKNFSAHLERGNIFFLDHNWRLALLDQQKAVEIDPSFQHGYLLVGLCKDYLNQPREALLWFDKALTCTGPETGVVHRSKGLILLKLGRLDDAHNEVLLAVKINVVHPEVKQDDLSALAKVEKTLELRKLNLLGAKLSPQLIEAEQLYLQKRAAECLKLLSELIKIEPNNAEAHALEGDIYADSMEYEKAISEMTKAVAVAPGYQHGQLIIGSCQFRLDHYAQAFDPLDRAISCPGPETGNAHYVKSSVLLKMGRYKEALKEVDAAISIHTGSHDLNQDLCNRAAIDMAAKDYSALVADQGRKLKLCNGVFSADWQERADAYMLVGKVDLAISDYLQSLKIAKDNRDALRGLGEAYAKKGERAKAQKIKEQLQALDYSRF